MKQTVTRIVVYSALVVIIAVIGIIWRGREIKNIKMTNYGFNARLVMDYTSTNPVKAVGDLKQSVKTEHMHVLEESESGDYFWEMIGQTNRFWLFSSSVHKTTIVADPTSQQDDAGNIIWRVQVFDRRIRSLSMLYFSMVVVCLMSVVAFRVRRNRLPHIFENSTGHENQAVSNDEI